MSKPARKYNQGLCASTVFFHWERTQHRTVPALSGSVISHDELFPACPDVHFRLSPTVSCTVAATERTVSWAAFPASRNSNSFHHHPRSPLQHSTERSPKCYVPPEILIRFIPLLIHFNGKYHRTGSWENMKHPNKGCAC